MTRDHLIRVEPADGTPDGSKSRVYKQLKAALRYAVKLVEANAGAEGAQAYVSSTYVDFNSLNIFRNDGEYRAHADYLDDENNVHSFDLSILGPHQ